VPRGAPNARHFGTRPRAASGLLFQSTQGLVDYVVDDDMGALLHRLGIADAQVVQLSPTWSEQIVRFVTKPAFASVLMSVGLLGLLVEILEGESKLAVLHMRP
jgi:membrane-bound ClpP family serine protease